MRINKHLNNNNKQDEDFYFKKKEVNFDRSAIHKFPFPFIKTEVDFCSKNTLKFKFFLQTK